MNRIQRYIDIEPMNVSPGNWLRFIVRSEMTLAVVAQFHAGWNWKNPTSGTSNPGLTSITIHRRCWPKDGETPDHEKCTYLHDSGSVACQTRTWGSALEGNFFDTQELLQTILLKEGSIEVLDYLEHKIYMKELDQ